jgi:hypothetical protein
MTDAAIFVRDGHGYTATDLAIGPWFAGSLHGGAPAALIVRELLAAAGDGAPPLARITYEFVRPVPVGPLTVEVEVLRPGRRVRLLEAVLRDGDGVEVTRARALLALAAEAAATRPAPPPFPGPETAAATQWGPGERGFAVDAVEIRFVEGEFREPGRSTAWFRLRHPLVAGESTAPLERLAAFGDFGNGIASVLRWDEHVFINPDLTLYVERPPAGEWVALQSEMRVQRGSVAVAESVLWDERGRIGRATQSLLVWER